MSLQQASLHSPEAETPAPQKLITAAQDLIPWLRARGPQHDDAKRISSEVAERLRALGFFRICQSRANGGYGMRPSVLWRVTRELARGDSATAWIHGLAGLHPWVVGMFEPRAQDEVFAHGRDAVAIALTGNVGRGVKATRESEGYRVTGKWSYASGIDIADWVFPLVEVPAGDGGTEQRLLLVPQSGFRIDHESWNVFGMRGTGSKDVFLSHEFVPFHRTVRWTDVLNGEFPGRARNTDPMYGMPHTSLFVMSVAAPIIGVACGVLDIYIETLRKRVPAGTGVPQNEDRFSLAELGKAASTINLAFNSLLRAADQMYDQAAAGRPFTLEQRAGFRMEGATIAEMARSAGDQLVRNLGGSLLPNGPLERCFRDLRSMASHFLIQTNPSAEWFGRILLGQPLPPNARV